MTDSDNSSPLALQLDELCRPCAATSSQGDSPSVLLRNVLVPDVTSYVRRDVVLANGKIEAIDNANEADVPTGAEVIDCTHRMLMPGFVNAHTHSTEHWTRGLILPLPLELWVLELMRHTPVGDKGWHDEDSFVRTAAAYGGLSAIHCGAEAMLSGCTAIMDHLFARNADDVGAAVQGYKALGIRAFIAPMLNDDAVFYSNYIPRARDAEGRNAAIAEGGCPCCAMGKDGVFRTAKDGRDPAKTEAALALWKECVERYHDPAGGIEIVVGPVTAYSASEELLRGCAEMRKKYNLLGHTHLLETRAQALMAKQNLPSGSAVKHLRDTGFLDTGGRPTSCAHTVWLDDEEIRIMAECNATAVHNPLSNLRLGSGVMPVARFREAGVNVAIGCDGSCSSDGQDMLEAIKSATILAPIQTPNYRDWPRASDLALNVAARNGYKGVGTNAGVIEVGAEADVTLWDLTAMSMLPRTDPLSLLIQGSRTQSKAAGSALNSAWVRGKRVIADGELVGVDLAKLREILIAAQPEYRDMSVTNPTTDSASTASAEVEYRAAMGLDPSNETQPRSAYKFEEHRALYDPHLT